jgi:hypothetical protein
MTLEEFIDALAQTRSDYDWELTTRGWIRGHFPEGGDDWACPITAVAEELGHGRFSAEDALDVGMDLGLGGALTEDIVKEADHPNYHDIRDLMLEALGLPVPDHQEAP